MLLLKAEVAVDMEGTAVDDDEEEETPFAKGRSHQRGCVGGLPQIDEDGFPL